MRRVSRVSDAEAYVLVRRTPLHHLATIMIQEGGSPLARMQARVQRRAEEAAMSASDVSPPARSPPAVPGTVRRRPIAAISARSPAGVTRSATGDAHSTAQEPSEPLDVASHTLERGSAAADFPIDSRVHVVRIRLSSASLADAPDMAAAVAASTVTAEARRRSGTATIDSTGSTAHRLVPPRQLECNATAVPAAATHQLAVDRARRARSSSRASSTRSSASTARTYSKSSARGEARAGERRTSASSRDSRATSAAAVTVGPAAGVAGAVPRRRSAFGHAEAASAAAAAAAATSAIPPLAPHPPAVPPMRRRPQDVAAASRPRLPSSGAAQAPVPSASAANGGSDLDGARQGTAVHAASLSLRAMLPPRAPPPPPVVAIGNNGMGRLVEEATPQPTGVASPRASVLTPSGGSRLLFQNDAMVIGGDRSGETIAVNIEGPATAAGAGMVAAPTSASLPTPDALPPPDSSGGPAAMIATGSRGDHTQSLDASSSANPPQKATRGLSLTSVTDPTTLSPSTHTGLQTTATGMSSLRLPPGSATNSSMPRSSASSRLLSDSRAVIAGYVAGNVRHGHGHGAAGGAGGTFRGTTVMAASEAAHGEAGGALPAPPTAAPGSPLDEALAADVAAEAQRRALLRRPHLKPEVLKRLEVGDEAYEARRAAKRLGKVITKEHVLYQTSFAMMLGIYTSVVTAAAAAPLRAGAVTAAPGGTVAPSPQVAPLLPLRPTSQPLLLPPKLMLDDFMRVHKLVFPPRGSATTPPHRLPATFRFKDYAPRVFAQLRERWSVDSTHYLRSLGGAYEYIEFASNSKSGAFFFYSADGRFMIKTQSRSESKLLRRILAHYYGYAMANPGTYITRFYGMHRITLPHVRRKLHFVVMASVWAGDRPVHEMYDLKGSTVGRAASEEERRRGPAAAVFKDLDLISSGTRIQLGPGRREAFLAQVSADAAFLASMQIMDYSLLLGVHHASMSGVAATHALVPSAPAEDKGVVASQSVLISVEQQGGTGLVAGIDEHHDGDNVAGHGSAEDALVPGGSVGMLREAEHAVSVTTTPTMVAHGTQTGGYGSDDRPLKTRKGMLSSAGGDDGAAGDSAAPVALSRMASQGMLSSNAVSSATTGATLRLASLSLPRRQPPRPPAVSAASSSAHSSPAFGGASTGVGATNDRKDEEDNSDASSLQSNEGANAAVGSSANSRGARAGDQPRLDERRSAEHNRAARDGSQRRHLHLNVHADDEDDDNDDAEQQHTGTIAGLAIGEHGERVSGLPPGALEPPPEPSAAAGGGICGALPDGSPADETYFVGIIDVLQQYDLRKMGETALKSLMGQSPTGISAVAPKFYAERFVRFIAEHTV